MRLVLLDADTLGHDLDLTPIEKFGKLIKYHCTKADETLSRIEDADIVLTNKVVINRSMMEQSPKLKLICVTATGMNNIDLIAAKELGIEVKNVAGYSTESVAQHTMAMGLYLIEKLGYYNNTVKCGTWSRGEMFTDLSKPFFEISGKQWGIIGLGAIGREVATVATAFGATVSYYSTSGNNRKQAYQHKELDRLLSESDIISIHAPLNEQTKNLISKDNLSLLKEGAILLNLGRGGIVNEADLAEKLNNSHIYVGLDVMAKEPIEIDNPLLCINNPEQLLITPHIAWASIEAREKLLDRLIENIRTFVDQCQC